jgi:hypothetical protein
MSVSSGRLDRMDWEMWTASDLPTWLAAVGTVGTLAVAVWVLKREQDDRRERDRQERRQQARRVAVSEPTSLGGSSATMQDTGGHVMALKYAVTISNHSDETLNSCRLRWIGALTDPPKDASGWIFDRAEYVGRVLPRDEVSRQQPVPVRMDADGVFPHKIHSELLFTDSGGARWLRDREHALHEVIGDDPW